MPSFYSFQELVTRGGSVHPHAPTGRIGILLANLGTPDGTDYWSVRRYLKEFLSDRRVIEMNRILWWPLLYCIILTTRPWRSGRAYEKIWVSGCDESPLRVFTRAQAEKLSERFSGREDIVVDWSMRYGQPSIGRVLGRLKAQGCTRILFFPLYPQYSASTTATANDAVFKVLLRMRWQPTLRFVPPYYDDPVYIEALAASLELAVAKLDFKPERIIVSFHGLPRSSLEKGDPYYCHCSKTRRLLCEKLNFSEEEMILTFQSRFGRAEWLRPYTDEKIEQLAREGIKKIAVITPGFVSDCVETLEEIALEGRRLFEQCGGTHFAFIPCLNESDLGLSVIEHIARREIAGWA